MRSQVFKCLVPRKPLLYMSNGLSLNRRDFSYCHSLNNARAVDMPLSFTSTAEVYHSSNGFVVFLKLGGRY